MIRLARTPQSVIATLLALLAIAVRLLLPALHSHADVQAAAPAAATNQPLLGGCPCDPWATAAYDFDEWDADPPRVEGAPLQQVHFCLACDFELAQPALLPPPAAIPAKAVIQLRAPPAPDHERSTALVWARPPTRAPPRPTANA